MPKLYEYLGLVIFFYSNEHEPIHVHARHADCESKIEILIANGQIKKLVLKPVKGKRPLSTKQQREFKKLTKVLADEIVQSWVNYFVYHKKIVTKKISGKL